MRLLVWRYCARSSATSWPAPSSPLDVVVRTETDSAELHGRVASNINSRLTYKQIPRSVERHNTAPYIIYKVYKFVQYLASKAVS